MKRLFLILIALLAPSIVWGQNWSTLPGGADAVINMYTSAPGTVFTAAIGNAGVVCRPGTTCSWGTPSTTCNGSGSFSPLPGVFAVEGNQGAFNGNLGPVQVNNGGPLFPPASLLGFNIAHADGCAGPGSNATFNVTGGGTTSVSVLFGVTLTLPTAETNPNDIDMLILWGNGTNNFSTTQFNAQNVSGSPCTGIPSTTIGVRLELKPTIHTPCIPLPTPGSYWITQTWNMATNSGTLHAYTANGTPVRCIAGVGGGSGTCNADGGTTVTGGAGGNTFEFITIGNNESGYNAGTVTYFQNIMLNWTNAQTPYFWTNNEPWAPDLAPSRGVSWSSSGVPGGIPARTSPVCANEPAGTPAATINAAITACSNSGGGVVNLAAGSYSGALSFGSATNVTVRGLGANLSLFSSTGNWSLGGGLSIGSNLTTWAPGGGVGGANPFAGLTTPWPAGINTISLASSTNLKVGTLVVLDQLDQTVDYGGILVTQSSTALTAVAPGVAGAYVSQGDGQNVSRGTCTGSLSGCFSQQQAVIVTQCDGVTTQGHACASGANITINPPIAMPNWGFDLGGNSLTPGAWYSSNLPNSNNGLEDVGIDMTSCSGCVLNNIGGYSDWVKGIAITNVSPSNEGMINTPYALELSIVNNYIGVSTVSGAGVYGVNAGYCNFCRIENNFAQSIPTPYIFNGGGVGNVWGYNFAVGGFYTASSQYNIPAFGDHAAGIAKNLFEGNQINGYTGDSIHGVGSLETFNRNNFWGSYPSCWVSGSTEPTSVYGQCTQNMTPLNTSAGHRLNSSFGNIFGMSGVQTTYSTTSFETGSGPYAIYQYGSQTSSVADSANLQQSAAIFGNADVVTGFASPRFNCNEVMLATTFASLNAVWRPFANPCPLSNTLPASFYYSSKPSWWPSGKAWPIIGPDITGGNLLLCTGGTQARTLVTTTTASLCTAAGGTTSVYAAGLSNSNPAMDCALSLGMNPNGTGGPLTNFNEATCYSGSGPPPVAATPACVPTSGTFTAPLAINCSDTSAGAIMCYTTNGTSPATNGATACANGTLYTTTITFNLSGTLEVIAGGTGFTDSSIVTYIYTIQANTPTCLPGTGVYNASVSVTCSDTSAGTVICYTTNGATPQTNGISGCNVGTLYSGTITVLASLTLQAVAGGTGYADSTVMTNTYTIIPPPAPRVQVFTLF